MKLYRFFLLELKNNLGFSLLFVLNLSLGLVGFVALDGFKASVDKSLATRSKGVLGADLGISARRPLQPEELVKVRTHLPKSTKTVKTTELYSMISKNREQTRLVFIKAVSEGYPFYGGVLLEGKNIPNREWSSLHKEDSVWIFKDLKTQMNLKIGDILKVGELEIPVSGVIVDDSSAGIGARFAPTIYMSQRTLEKTKLIQPGSVAWHSELYQLPLGRNIESLKDQMFGSAPNQDLRVYTHSDASQQMARLVESLNDYLGLAAVVALFLAAVGAGFLYRSYFQKKITELAVLISLGLKASRAIQFYFFQLTILGILSAFLSLGFGILAFPVLQSLTKDLLPFEFDFILPASTLWVALGLGVFSSLLICLPFWAQLRDVKPSLLFSYGLNQPVNQKGAWRTYLLMAPGVLVLWGLAVYQANSLIVGSLFLLSFVVSGLLLIGVAYGALRFLGRAFLWIAHRETRWALRDISREKAAAISCFLALGLGAVLMNLIPQLQKSLDRELQFPEHSVVPSLFLFDIQEDQVDLLNSIAKSQAVEFENFSPMIRGRLMAVNDEDFSKGTGAGSGLSREEEREMRFRNRGFNLSYRDSMLSSESLFSGESVQGAFNPDVQKDPWISVEKRFADRLKLELGDRMQFEIEGIPVAGVIRNFRTVRWTSFQPNFFIQFQPGVLEEAPKTFIATVSRLNEQAKAQLQSAIVREVPNISIIDVSQLVKKLAEIVFQMSLALKVMAYLCLGSGLVVVYSIVSHQTYQKRWQVGLLKSFGASQASIRKQFLVQYISIALAAGCLGVLVSLVLSFGLARFLFDSTWEMNWQSPLLTLFMILGLTIIVIEIAGRRNFRQSPRALLGGSN